MYRKGTAPSASHAPLLMTAQQAADALAISPRLLWTLTHGRQIPCIRIGRSVRYDPTDLQTWIASQKQTRHVPACELSASST
jgi:excisionase family DNA binding protein